MAQHPFNQAFAQNKGTLLPGQTIIINQYTVQVERYLTQGGFAHVYLVTTSTPVFNTHRHVLKRIAVPNESMLAEVKKEVDIMRVFKGHPNIVQLIDASWNKMTTGVYEVFILMEFCSGGGIIDMMNRRLRERLTEAEILTIFVNVCEGVAAMHNLRPALLHRDLKVENILQASETSYKLCDFGSAAPVAPRPPSSMQEIRALEADLNRHTTLQYRAPEMVDPYMRRPIDEKSDVWALGVLLYKLCYYTTPFEEHGPLAILSVQYRTPSYPRYSDQMNAMIASMLQEHGARRPHVFEMLATVHRIRGTKSRFTYVLPSPPPLSPRSLPFPPNTSTPNSLHKTGSRHSATIQAVPAEKNAGIQAREKVLEAIAPMRRGRPTDNAALSTGDMKSTDWLRDGQAKKEEERPRTAPKAREDTGAKSAQRGSSGAWIGLADLDSEAWTARGTPHKDKDVAPKDKIAQSPLSGFGDDFSSKSIWELANSGPSPPGLPPPKSMELPRSMSSTPSSVKPKDAFEGLGLSVAKVPAPTLGEARKLRTGLAIMQGSSRGPQSLVNDAVSQKPSTLLPTTPSSNSKSPAILTGSHSASQPTYKQHPALPPEARFPSVEELDASFATPAIAIPSTPKAQSANDTGLQVPSSRKTPNSSSLPPRSSHSTGGLPPPPQVGPNAGGARSAHVTGIAMRAPRRSMSGKRPENTPIGSSASTSKGDTSNSAFARSRRRSASVKRNEPSIDLLGAYPPPSAGLAGVATAHMKRDSKDQKPGVDDEHRSREATTSTPGSSRIVLPRESPRKHTAYEQTHAPTRSPRAQQTNPPRARRPSSPSPIKPKPSVTGSARAFRPAELLIVPKTSNNAANTLKDQSNSTSLQSPADNNYSSSSADEGPEDVHGYVPHSRVDKSTPRYKEKARQNSVHELVDLWSAGVKDRERDVGRPPAASSPKDLRAHTKVPRMEATALASPVVRPSSPQKPSSSVQASSMANASPKHPHVRRSSKAGLVPASPVPSRTTRPQSMFVFPSSNTKAEETPSEQKSALDVASQAQSKSGVERRTSISEIVHHYEAIDEGAKGHVASTTAPLSAGPKFDSGASPHGSGRYPKLLDTAPPNNAGLNLRLDPSSTSQQTQEVLDKSRVLPSASTVLSRHKESGDVGHLSTKPLTEKPVSEATLPQTTFTQERPASPDKPYQGVSKLIDQWQRKTAEADPSNLPPPRRSRFVAK